MDVNIHDRRGQDALTAVLGMFAAIIAGFILFGLMPGLILTSVVNYFLHMTTGQLWGLTIVLSAVVFLLIKFQSASLQQAMKRYAIVATVTGCLLGLSALFLKYSFPVRTTMRLFDDEKNIPYKHFTAPSELLNELAGTYGGESFNTTYNSKGDVMIRIFRINTKTDSLEAWVEWSNGLQGYTKLTGTLKGNELLLVTLPDDRNDVFNTVIKGKLAEGKLTGGYEIAFKDKNDQQEGTIEARNLRFFAN